MAQPKMIILIQKKKGMSREDFIHHYETSHAVIGKRLLGHLWAKYVRNYPLSLMEYQPEENSVDDSYDAVTEIWFRMLLKLSTVRKDGLATPKNTTRAISVMKGAMLRSWLPSMAPSLEPALRVGVVCASIRSSSPVTPPRAGGPC